MADWTEEIPEELDDVELTRRATRLANILGRYSGSREEKVAFCIEEMELWEAEADKQGAIEPKKRAGAIRSLCIRYWRHRLRNGTLGMPKAEQSSQALKDALRARHGDPNATRDHRVRPASLRVVAGSRNRRED